MVVYELGPYFQDRDEAGTRLAGAMASYADRDAVVFAVPRGGVPVGIRIARMLDCPFDLVIPRKIGIPWSPEAGFGAVAEDGALVLNRPLVERLRLSDTEIQRLAETVRAEVARRAAVFRARLPETPVEGRTAIITDDGLATGYTVLAAIESLRRRRAAEIVVASPVASGGAVDLLTPAVDTLVTLIEARTHGFAVAAFYRRWTDMTDAEVFAYLDTWRERRPE